MAEGLALKKQIDALARMARETMGAIEKTPRLDRITPRDSLEGRCIHLGM
jgi:hypothetical protein